MIILTPAYGRVYKTQEEMLMDWFAGKDFKILNGPYTSARDFWDLTDQFGLVMLSYGLNGRMIPAPEPDEDTENVLFFGEKPQPKIH